VKVDSLEQLGAAFSQWRQKKGHRREATPADLVRRASAAVRVHGRGRVAQVAKIDGRRLSKGPGRGAQQGDVSQSALPSYSRLRLTPPVVEASRPFAELEMPNGMRLRLYSGAEETMALLSSVCSAGGGR
jgi:hypothetical protein